MAPIAHYSISTYYYITPDSAPIISDAMVTETTGLFNITPSSIESVMGITLPPHMVFKGWYSPDAGITINMDDEQYFELYGKEYSNPFIVYAKWEINTKFNHKETTLFDFSQGGVNVTSETLAKGVTAYDANGMLIVGTKEV